MKYNAKYYPINNKKPEHRRHDMSDKMWSKLAPLLPEHMGKARCMGGDFGNPSG